MTGTCLSGPYGFLRFLWHLIGHLIGTWAGSYSLATPFDGKSASLSFERRDEDTIKVTITSGRISYSFYVSKSGAITDG